MKRNLGAGLLALSVWAVGCGAAPQEDAGSSEDALTVVYTRLPEAVCTLVAGADTSGLGRNQVAMKIGGGYNGPDANVMQFQHAILSLGPSGGYTIRKGFGANSVSWYALDVSKDAPGAVTSIVDTYAGTSPVFSGYYECDYLWGDFEIPPGGTRPYVPSSIVAYDPRGCSSCSI